MENENEETQKAPATDNGASTPEDLAAIKAELEEEKKAKAAIEAALTDKAKRITELEASLNVVSQAGEAAATELASMKEAHAKAVSKYLDASRALNPTIPQDVIVGSTVEEIDASLGKAKAIATAIKANLEAQAKEAKVPAGAPTRGEISLEGLSPREKIAAGIHQKGGTQS
jgi:vacuolar-type H+-ATPase subunit I/STV1